MRARYTLFQYDPGHWAIDCEVCNNKIVNLVHDQDHPAYMDAPHIVHRLSAHTDWHLKHPLSK